MSSDLISFITETSLSQAQMRDAVSIMMRGEASHDQIAEFLTVLAERGETSDEITGAAQVMRDMAQTITAPAGAVDCCGTGGDGAHTYNISTAVALVAASCGVPVAKHGNRAASSKSGAADVLEALGVNLDISTEALEDALQQFNFCFLMATNHHQAMKHVVPVRKQLGFRTIFNLLGPLANPAGTKRQLIGVFDQKWLRPMAEVLSNLGTEKAWLVHGDDGLDEITTTTTTHIVSLEHGEIKEFTLSPEEFGISLAKPEDLQGGDANYNADALRAILKGEHNAYRDIVLLNTAAVLVVHNSAQSIEDGLAQAAQAIDSGHALQTLERYANFTQEQKKAA